MKTLTAPKLDDIRVRHWDVMVAASGYETRSHALAATLRSGWLAAVKRKEAWGFEEYAGEGARVKNDAYFARHGFTRVRMPGNASGPAEERVAAVLKEASGRQMAMVVDISSMTRTWYGGVVRALANASGPPTVRTVFGYTPAAWSRSVGITAPNDVVGPVVGYASYALPDRPVALLVGLGTEADRALGLRDYLDPERTVCFLADPGTDRRYHDAVLERNRDLLNTVQPDDVFPYDLFDTVGAFRVLESVCHGLAREYRVVLASLGPKLFGLYCFLIHAQFGDVSVWRVSPGARRRPFDHRGDKWRVFLEVEWVA